MQAAGLTGGSEAHWTSEWWTKHQSMWHLRNEASQPPSALGSTQCPISKSMMTPDGQAALWAAMCCERESVSNRSWITRPWRGDMRHTVLRWVNYWNKYIFLVACNFNTIWFLDLISHFFFFFASGKNITSHLTPVYHFPDSKTLSKPP